MVAILSPTPSVSTAPPPRGTAVALDAAELLISIVSYQTADEVGVCVDSLRAHPPQMPWHIVVIDNGSPDGSINALRARFDDAPDVTVVDAGGNLGFGQANNLVARMSEAPYLALVNPDCCTLEDGLTPSVTYLEANPSVGVVGPQVLTAAGEVEATARRFPTLSAGLAGRRSILRKIWPSNPWSRRFMVAHLAVNGALLVDWVAGTVMVMRRKEFLELGGFDPAYFLYWEDCDLCWRYLKAKNLATMYLPQGAIKHSGDAAGSKAKAFAIREFHKAAYTLVRRHVFRSPWHPMGWFAWVMLSLRAQMLLSRAKT